MKTAIIYHQVKPGIDCADGIAAAWVAKRKYPDAALIGACYGGETPDVRGFDRLLIVDFSFPLPVLNEWKNSGKQVAVIDHHKTAMADLAGFEGAIFDMNESGATLAWKTLFSDEPMPAMLAYVKDRDLWNFDLPMSEEIHEAMSFMGRKLFQLDAIARLSADELQSILAPLGAKLLEPKRQRIAELAATAHDAIVKGCRVKAVQVDESESRLTSDLCSAIYKANPTVLLVMAYSWNSKDKVWALAFRSDKNGLNVDVSEIAKQFSGGGHRNAAGGKADNLEDVFDCKFIVTYDNGSGYREWSCAPQTTPIAAIEAAGGLTGYGEPRLEII